MVQPVLDQAVLRYLTARQKAMKRIVRQMRKEAHYSQGEVAEFLGCSRTRITEIEREESGAVYSVGELELLAVLFGRHPLDVLHMSGLEAITVGEMVTSKQTGLALLREVDCSLPKRIERLLKDDTEPHSLVFSPDGAVLTSIVDYYVGEDWQEEEPYQFTVLCWDAQSGTLLGQIRRAHVKEVAPINAALVVMLRDTAHGRSDVGGHHEYESDLLVWDVREGAIVKKIKLPERAQLLAVSPDGAYVAVYMEATTTIQVWHTATWEPICAFELGILRQISHDPGGAVRVAREVGQLPREQKLGLWMARYRPRHFDFLQNDVLVVAFSDTQVELEVGPGSRGAVVPPPIETPRVAQNPVTYVRDQHRRIAVLAIDYDQHSGDSLVSLYYQVPEGKGYPPDTYLKWDKCFPGSVHQPVIIDEGCILATTAIDTPYPWGIFHKQHVGLLNLVSGRLVMLTDGGRLRKGDNQQGAKLSPRANAVAYWVLPYEGVPRLSIQYFDGAPLLVEGGSLANELEQERQRREEEW